MYIILSNIAARPHHTSEIPPGRGTLFLDGNSKKINTKRSDLNYFPSQLLELERMIAPSTPSVVILPVGVGPTVSYSLPLVQHGYHTATEAVIFICLKKS